MDSPVNISMSIQDLPHDMILHIFKFIGKKDLLFSVRNTCVLWNQLSKYKIFWKKLDVSDFPNYVFTENLYLKLLEEIQDFVEILVFDLKHNNLNSIRHSSILCPNIREIEFKCKSKISISEMKSAFATLSVKYPELKKLTLCSYIPNKFDVFCSLQDFSFTGEDRSLMTWKQFFAFHPHLRAITFRNCSLDSDVCSHIFTQYPELETLDISGCDSVFSEIYDDIKGEASLNLSKLLYLNISETDITDSLIKMITQCASQLKWLNISSCPRLTNSGVEAIGTQCKNLRTLIINIDEFSHTDVSFSGVKSIADNCKQLEVLKLNHCPEVGDDGIKSIVTSCSELKELEIAGCLSLQDSTIISLAEKCRLIQKLKVSGCSKLTSRSLSLVLTECKHLMWLNMESCHRVSDMCLQKHSSDGQIFLNSEESLISDADQGAALSKSLTSIVVPKIHSHVTTLIMNFCSMVTNNCMKNIAIYCPDLRTLDVQACYLVTNAGIREVLKRCQFLRHLNISGGSVSQTSRIDNDCLGDVMQYGDNLEELMIVDNYNITVDGIMPIIQNCRNIRSLSVGFGKRTNISKEGLIDMSGNVENKTVCLQFKVNAEILVYDDAESSLKQDLVATG